MVVVQLCIEQATSSSDLLQCSTVAEYQVMLELLRLMVLDIFGPETQLSGKKETHPTLIPYVRLQAETIREDGAM